MSLHVVVGAGPVGTTLAIQLADLGHDVRVVTRSGRGPAHPRIELIAADASAPETLLPHAVGAAALYNCANPPTYVQWAQLWPPLAASMLATAETTAAVLVTANNLYGYGPVDGPMTPDLPLAATGPKGRLRAQIWRDALASHEAGRARVTEVRSSDYLGPGLGSNHGVIIRCGQAAVAGRTAYVLGDPRAPHSWSFVPDVARALATVGTDERAWGRAWHVPTNPPVPVRALLAEATARVGARPPRVRRLPNRLVRLLAPMSPLMREVSEVLYQFERPFEIDSTATISTFALEPTPWDEVVRSTADAWQAASGARP
ncbi:MAG: NAD-dependent epimerase/dehydratase family protein [Jiangellaceae bacterium]